MNTSISKPEYRAYLHGYRVSARKARLVADLVRGRLVVDALEILRGTNKRTAPIISRMIRQAIAAAQNEGSADVDQLVVGEIFVDEGPTLRRFLPRAQGRATPVRKRSSHITLNLLEV